MTTRTKRALLLAGSAVTLAVALSGCSAINSILGSGDADRDEETGQVTESANIDVFSLEVGDCMAATDSTEIDDVDVVPCTEPHEEEVFYEITMDDGAFSDAAIDAASESCGGPAFTDFVGLAYDDSVLEVYPIVPTEGSWDDLNDRVVQCVISDPAGSITVSLKGAAR